MLDIKQIRENPEKIEQGLALRGVSFDASALIALDDKRRAAASVAEELQRNRNEASKIIGQLRKAGEDATERQAEVRAVGEKLKEAEEEQKTAASRVRDALLTIPNIPHPSTPPGADEEANVELRRWGAPRTFDFEPKSHNDLGEALGLFDFKRAAKLSGARFSLQFGQAAKMERALAAFMLDTHTRKHGYTEVMTPFMVNSDTMRGTGQLPKFADDLFRIEKSDYWLIPTAEVTVTNIHAGEIIDGTDLPLKFTAHTPCFRAEAGSYGKDTAGLIRQHQFNKVEMVKIVVPEEADQELESLTANAEAILQALELPYRIVQLCGGDLGFSAAKTYDLEVWVPSQNTFREISSCSCFTDYQARRMNMRFRRDKKAKPEFPYTINGSGLAVGRTLVAIFENGQNEDGSINIPTTLQDYMGGERVIVPR